MTGAGEQRPPSRTAHHRGVKADLAKTEHPRWVLEMLQRLAPDWQAVRDSEIFKVTVKDGVDDEIWRNFVCEFFPIVEAFPKYMGVYLGRTTFHRRPGDQLARDWLIGNIRTEALHAQWYLDWGAGLGLEPEQIINHRPRSESTALYEYLWSAAYRGSLAAAFGAVNYAIEGTTGEWVREVMPAFETRFPEDKHILLWLAQHAEYDDAHPREALELVKICALDDDDQAATETAIRGALELTRVAFAACTR